MIKTYLSIVANEMLDISSRQAEWRERIIKEWHESKNLPRKKKKQKRKGLLIDWQLANYDPFNIDIT